MRWSKVYCKAIQEDGSLLFPERLTREFLDQARKTMGTFLFNSQYMNDPVPEADQTFKREWIRYYSPQDLYEKRLMHFAFVDPAIGESKHHDFTGVVVIATDQARNWFVKYASRQRLNPTQIIDLIFRIHKEFQCQAIGVEDVAFQRSIIHFAVEEARKRGTPLPITGVKRGPDKTKQMRILQLVPRMEWGSLFLNGGLHDLELELAQFPRGAHDDLCFTAGTRVLTPAGHRNIESLKVGDRVLTPLGEDEITHTASQVAPVITSGVLEGTPGHKVWTWNGLTRLDALSCTDDVSRFTWKHLIRWSALSALVSMESNSKEWVGRDYITCLNTNLTSTEKPRRLGFMSLFTSFIRERRYRRGMTFTIRMVIRLTMALRIWSAYHVANTRSWLVEIVKKCWQTWIEPGFSHLSGIDRMRAVNGIEKTANMFGLTESKPLSFVFFVGKNISPLFQVEPALAVSIANKDSGTERSGILLRRNAPNALTHLWVENGQPLKPVPRHAELTLTEKRVYNIRTKRHRLYYANGILVSNCDALASIEEIVHYPSPERRHNEELPPNHPGYEAQYRRKLFRRAGSEETNR